MTLIHLQEEIPPTKLNNSIAQLIKRGIKKINVVIPLFGFEILIFNLLKAFKDYVTFDANFKKILRYTTISQRFKLNDEPPQDIHIHVTNVMDPEKNQSRYEHRTIKVVEGYSSNIRSFIDNLDIVTWSVLPIGTDIEMLVQILRPLSKKSIHDDYFSHSSLGNDVFFMKECSHQNISRVTRVFRDADVSEVSNIEVNNNDFNSFIETNPYPPKKNIAREVFNKYCPGFLESLLVNSDKPKTPEEIAFDKFLKETPMPTISARDTFNKFFPGFLESEADESEKEETICLERTLLPKMSQKTKKLCTSIRKISIDSETSVNSNDSIVTIIENNQLSQTKQPVTQQQADFILKFSQDVKKKRQNIVYEEFSDSEL